MLSESRKPAVNEEERELTATRSFQGFQYWNLDRNPSKGDTLYQALSWIDIAQAVSLSFV